MTAVVAVYSSGKAKRFKSLRAASRELSGDGTDRRRSLITQGARLRRGDFIINGTVWVKKTR